MENQSPKAVYYSQGEAQNMRKVPFGLTMEEFKENLNTYPLVITNGFSTAFEDTVKSRCWLIKDYAVFRIVFSNGISTDRYIYENHPEHCPIQNKEKQSKENLELGHKWIEELDQIVTK